MIRPLQLFHIKLSKTPENSIQFNSNAYKISEEIFARFHGRKISEVIRQRE